VECRSSTKFRTSDSVDFVIFTNRDPVVLIAIARGLCELLVALPDIPFLVCCPTIKPASDRLETNTPRKVLKSSPRAHHSPRMLYVCVLQSEKTEQLYTGFTADLEQRIGQHNAGITKSTKNRGPWKLLHQEQFDSRAEAMRREKFLKSGNEEETPRPTICMEQPRKDGAPG
jgi:putative endonuclease